MEIMEEGAAVVCAGPCIEHEGGVMVRNERRQGRNEASKDRKMNQIMTEKKTGNTFVAHF